MRHSRRPNPSGFVKPTRVKNTLERVRSQPQLDGPAQERPQRRQDLRQSGMRQVELVHQQQRVAPGSAVRIMTGALVPVDTAAVVRFEETDEVATSLDGLGRRHGSIGVLHQTAFGENIRPAGEDVCAGTLALASTRRAHW